MDRISDYRGTLLNHVEALYRPGERALAIAIAEALGCAISDTHFTDGGAETFLAAHPNVDDRDMQSNAFYMSPMRPEQLALEEQLQGLGAKDEDLARALARYRQTARSRPFGVAHFSLRYPSADAIRQVVRALEPIATRLDGRLHVRVFWPTAEEAAAGRRVQGFVHQDVIVSGSFLMGQLIELQSVAG